MSLRLRAVHIRVGTPIGPVGLRQVLPDGLVVLRADNSSGKSTFLQSFVYGLGLEGMFGSSHEVPLPHAVTHMVSLATGDQPVLDSEVVVEIENAKGDKLTASRAIKGERNRHLITVWRGPRLTDPQFSGQSKDYYVRTSGAAVNPNGFHNLLAEFIGWDLPTVPRYQGADGMLYMEAVFPLLFVEQKKGWLPIEGRYPTHLAIRDVATRSVEFLLMLDSKDLEAKKAAIREKTLIVRGKWVALGKVIEGLAGPNGVVVRDVPGSPSSTWPPSVPPTMVAAEGESWQLLSSQIKALQKKVKELEQTTIPTVQENNREAETELRAAQESLARLERAGLETVRQHAADRDQLIAVQLRLTATREDLAKNKDARTLRRLGSVDALTVVSGSCPTCHQEVSAGLLPPAKASETMGLDDNISFLEEQERVFRLMHQEAEKAIAAREAQIAGNNVEIAELRVRIRALNATLVAAPASPSVAAVEERVRVGDRLQRLGSLERTLQDHLNGFAALASEWKEIQAEREALPTDDRSAGDEAKLQAVQGSIVRQLQAYGFDSLPPQEITLSRQNYKTSHLGFDLQFDLSASDAIRTAWAYRLALMEVSTKFKTNHPGILCLDEPRQQEVERSGYAAFLAEASKVAGTGRQVIIATSESADVIRKDLEDVPHTFIPFPGRLLEPL